MAGKDIDLRSGRASPGERLFHERERAQAVSSDGPLLHPRVFTWDWKEQPPMEKLAAALPGQPFMHVVPDTGGDCYACVLSSWPLTPVEAQAAYDQHEAGDEEGQ